MNAAFALSALLAFAPSQGASTFGISNMRLTYGELGSARPDNKYTPFDFVYVSFDIDGLKAAADGRVIYSMGLEVIDKAGKAVMSEPPRKSEMLMHLGGAKLPAYIFVIPGTEMQPGPYTCKITIIDDATKATKVAEQKFEIVPLTFGLVRLYVTKDENMLYACGSTGVVGQTVFINFFMVGFGRNVAKKPDAAVEFRILDADGQPTTTKPTLVTVPPEFPENESAVRFQFMIPLNREGSFTVEMKAADKISGKTATMTLPVKVYPAAK